MTAREREALLSQWIKRSSDSEQDQQDRAKRMVVDAVANHPAFRGVSCVVYVKGSYANNTNVRRDSDVDVVVENQECQHLDVDSDAHHTSRGSYQGIWTPQRWRDEVANAAVSAFGSAGVSSGRVALTVSAVAGSRPSIDIVPSFDYVRYTSNGSHRGSCVFPTTGSKIVNWPAQQLANGIAKNNRTNRRYKRYVRALKNAENALCEAGSIKVLPSYLMECLVWNVPDATLSGGSLDVGFRETLRFLFLGLDGDAHHDWDEPNRLKWLFRGTKGWTIAQARELVLKTWQMLDY
jgi:hypothetical protein